MWWTRTTAGFRSVKFRAEQGKCDWLPASSSGRVPRSPRSPRIPFHSKQVTITMSTPILVPSRRIFLGAVGAALFTAPGLFAEELLRTPPQTEGPFYPDKLPLDTDNDLLIVNDAITPAVGEIT